MISHYFKVSIRSMLRYKTSSLLNLFGLSLGISACIISWIFIQNEFSYDGIYSNHENIVRVSRSLENGEGGKEEFPAAPGPLGPLLEAQSNSFSEITRYWPTNGTALVSQENNHYNEIGVAQADGNFFKVFDIPFIIGDPLTAIQEPGAVVLNEELATKYFGSPQAAMGQKITVYRRGEVEVRGVFQDLPDNTHLQPKLIVSMTTTEPNFWLLNIWQLNFFHTYGVIADGVNIEKAQDEVSQLAALHIPADEGQKNSLTLWPIKNIHPYSTLQSELMPHNAFKLVERFVWVSLLMVITACFNYINMATAMGAVRAKEIAIRQVVGAQKSNLVTQFLFDALVTTSLAFIIAFGVSVFGLELLNAFLGKSLSLAGVFNFQSLVILFSLLVTISLAAGAYPAFAISSLNPAKILQGGRAQNVKHRMRQVLVILQFSIASTLILAITVVTHQNWYIDDFSKGYNSDNLVVLANLDDAEINIPILKEELLKFPNVVSVGASTSIPTRGAQRPAAFQKTAGVGEVQIRGLNIGQDFFDTYQIPLLAGRNISNERVRDDVNTLPEGTLEQSIIISRMAANSFGWKPEEAIGQIILREYIRLEIVGVVEDVHFTSIKDALIPQYYQLNSDEYNYVTIRIGEQNQGDTVRAIDKLALSLSPENQPAIRDTINERYFALYADEQSQQQILTFFSILVVLVACLGLFALASFVIKNRTMEIAVRKVMGAKPSQIIILMLRSFNSLVIVANIIALPVAGWLMIEWLNQFQYRIELGVNHLIVAFGISLIVATLTTFGQTLRIARLRPGITLREQ